MGKTLKAEFFRLKKICIWIPVISAIILVLFSGMEWYFFFRKQGGDYVIFNALYLFLSSSFLLCFSLLTTIIVETEHQAQGWKLLLSTPVSRLQLFFSKVVCVCMLMLAKCFLIITWIILIWLFFSNEAVPMEFLLKQVLGCFVACLPVLAIQMYISIRSSNPAIPFGIGVAGAILSLFIPRLSLNMAQFIPWAYPASATPFLDTYWSWIGLSVVVGIVLLCIGAISFVKMELK